MFVIAVSAQARGNDGALWHGEKTPDDVSGATRAFGATEAAGLQAPAIGRNILRCAR